MPSKPPAPRLPGADFLREVQLVGHRRAPVVAPLELHVLVGGAFGVEFPDVGVRGGGARDELVRVDAQHALVGHAHRVHVILLVIVGELDGKIPRDLLLKKDRLGVGLDEVRLFLAEMVDGEGEDAGIQDLPVQRLIEGAGAGQGGGRAHDHRIAPASWRD